MRRIGAIVNPNSGQGLGGRRGVAVTGNRYPFELDADPTLGTAPFGRREHVSLDEPSDIVEGEGGGRRGHDYRCPKWAATQVRLRTGADQRYQEFMAAPQQWGRA